MRVQHERTMLQHSPYNQDPEDRMYFSMPENQSSIASVGSWTSETRTATPDSSSLEQSLEPPPAPPRTVAEASRHAFINSTQKVPTISEFRAYKPQRDAMGDYSMQDAELGEINAASKEIGRAHV